MVITQFTFSNILVLLCGFLPHGCCTHKDLEFIILLNKHKTLFPWLLIVLSVALQFVPVDF